MNYQTGTLVPVFVLLYNKNRFIIHDIHHKILRMCDHEWIHNRCFRGYSRRKAF